MVISNRPISCADIFARFPDLFTDSVGDLQREVHRVSSPELGGKDSIIFLGTPKAFQTGIHKEAAAVVVSLKFKDQAVAAARGRTILISPNAELAMARVTDSFFLKTPYTNKSLTSIHPTAIISTGCEIAPDVRIGPHVFIGVGVKLGAGVYIGPNSIIEDDAEIGDGTVIHPLVYIGHSTQIGKRCEIMPQTTIGKEGFGYAHDARGNHCRIPHQGPVILEDDVHVGSSCTIDRGTVGETRVQSGTKIDCQSHLAHNCGIGKNGILTAGFMMAGSSRVGANFIAGGSSVVTGHIEIGDNVQIAGLSGVTKGVPAGQYGGFPLMPLQTYIKTKAAYAHLLQMRKQLKQIIEKLGLEDRHPE